MRRIIHSHRGKHQHWYETQADIYSVPTHGEDRYHERSEDGTECVLLLEEMVNW